MGRGREREGLDLFRKFLDPPLVTSASGIASAIRFVRENSRNARSANHMTYEFFFR